MRPVIKSLIWCLWIMVFASCERVIDVKLKGADKKYVIEGVLTNQAGMCKVQITQTQDFSDNNVFPGVSGARVTITDNAGVVTNLSESNGGSYTSSMQGKPGKKYTLNVSINGQVFTAASTMPQPVNLDSIYITDINFFNKINRLVNVRFKDPLGLGNNYRFVEYINSVKEKHIFVLNDDLIEGRVNTSTLYNRDSTVVTGDTVKVEMQCIDAAVYKYWFSLGQSATGDTESASPANPVSNFSSGALGYFSAHTVNAKTIIAK